MEDQDDAGCAVVKSELKALLSAIDAAKQDPTSVFFAVHNWPAKLVEKMDAWAEAVFKGHEELFRADNLDRENVIAGTDREVEDSLDIVSSERNWRNVLKEHEKMREGLQEKRSGLLEEVKELEHQLKELEKQHEEEGDHQHEAKKKKGKLHKREQTEQEKEIERKITR